MTGGYLDQPGFCATGTKGEKSDFSLGASREQRRNEERHGIAQGKGQEHQHSLLTAVQSPSLATQHFCWKSLF